MEIVALGAKKQNEDEHTSNEMQLEDRHVPESYPQIISQDKHSERVYI